VPAGLSNVVSVAASSYHNLALKNDGTVVTWGSEATNVPTGLTNVVAIACASSQSMALKQNGTVVVWGNNQYGQTNVPAGLTNIVALGGGANFSMAIVNDGSPWIVRQPYGQALYDGGGTILSAIGMGVQPLNYQWQLNGTNVDGETNAMLSLTNMHTNSGGDYTVIVSNAFGTILSARATVSVLPDAPAITVQPADESVLLGAGATFKVTARGVSPLNYQWRFNGTNIDGATNASFVLSAVQKTNFGNYNVIVSNAFGTTLSSNASLAPAQTLAWGENTYSQTSVPAGLSNTVAISAGYQQVLALKNDGTVSAWGASTNNMASIVDFGQTTVPVGLSNVVAVASGSFHSVALKSDGSVIAWGYNNDGETNVPSNATNVIAISTGYNHSLALKSDSTVISWGLNDYGQATVPSGLSNVIATAAGVRHSLALKNDGTVVVWGNQNVAIPFPTGLNNVIAVAAGGYHSIALKQDGTVVCWGRNAEGESTPPPGLRNVVAIAGGYFHSLALKSDGTLVGWGYDNSHQIDIPTIATNAVAITAGGNFSVTLLKSGYPFIVNSLRDQTVSGGQTVLINAGAWGALPLSYQWQFGGINIDGATNAMLFINNAQPSNSGIYSVKVTNIFGSVATSATLLVQPFMLNSGLAKHLMTTNGFLMQLDGVMTTNPVVIFGSTDLVSWLPIYTNSPATGSIQFLDFSATNLPARFYKAQE